MILKIKVIHSSLGQSFCLWCLTSGRGEGCVDLLKGGKGQCLVTASAAMRALGAGKEEDGEE